MIMKWSIKIQEIYCRIYTGKGVGKYVMYTPESIRC